jgi:hypothetical protein
VSNEHVWQKWIDTTLLITLSMVACHSGESPAVDTALMIGIEFESASMSYTDPF